MKFPWPPTNNNYNSTTPFPTRPPLLYLIGKYVHNSFCTTWDWMQHYQPISNARPNECIIRLDNHEWVIQNCQISIDQTLELNCLKLNASHWLPNQLLGSSQRHTLCFEVRWGADGLIFTKLAQTQALKLLLVILVDQHSKCRHDIRLCSILTKASICLFQID